MKKFGSVKDGTFKELDVKEIEALEAPEQVEYFNELNDFKSKQMDDFKAQLKKESTEEIQKKIDTLKAEIVQDNIDQMKVLQKAMEAQGMELRKLSGGNAVTRETLADYLDKNKSLLVQMVKEGKTATLVVKADTLRTSVTDSKVAYVVPDIGQLATRRLTLYDLFAKVPVGGGSGGVITYYDWDEATTARAAAVVAEGGTFPESTATFAWYTKPLVKVGDTLPVSEEFDADMPQFAAELSLFLQTNVDLVVDTQLYAGDGTAPNMTGLSTYAPAYVAVAQGMQDPSIYDLIVDVKRTIASGKGGKYMPNFVLMNSADIQNYKLKKDQRDNYIMPPFVSQDGKVIDGVVVIETAAVSANTLVMGDNRFAKIYEAEGYSITKGLADGDFTSDMYTLKARRRLMLLVKNADAGAFAKVTDIAAALVTLGTAV